MASKCDKYHAFIAFWVCPKGALFGPLFATPKGPKRGTKRYKIDTFLIQTTLSLEVSHVFQHPPFCSVGHLFGDNLASKGGLGGCGLGHPRGGRSLKTGSFSRVFLIIWRCWHLTSLKTGSKRALN